MNKVLVTGANGLVGSSLKRVAANAKDFEWVFIGRSDCDLTNQSRVNQLFERIGPTHVIHTAARVGGIGRNLSTPADQFVENTLMNTFVLESARKHGVKRLLAFSSVCAFPSDAEFFEEDNLHQGPPFPAHGAYAYAKRMVDVQIESYRNQYGLQYCSVIPGNIFGENDNFNLKDGHVVPSLVHKAYVAKQEKKRLSVWGDGSAVREFIYVDDLSNICIELLRVEDLPQRIIASGPEVSIGEMAGYIAKYAELSGIEWDTSMPTGQKRRQTRSKVFNKIFPDYKFFDIEEGVKKTVSWFFSNYQEARK